MKFAAFGHELPIRLFLDDDSGGGGGDDPGDSGGGGGDDPGGESWMDSLPEDVRGWDEVKNSDSPEKFWGQVANMRKFLGQSIRIPSEDAGTEDWQKFYGKLTAKVPGLMPKPNTDDEAAYEGIFKALGFPEAPEGYKPPEFEQEGLDMAPVESFRKVAHKHKLTQAQFEGIVKDMTATNLESVEAQKAAVKENQKKLYEAWGAKFDTNMRLIQGVVQKTDAPPKLVEAIVDGRVDYETGLWLEKMGRALGGEKVILGNDRDPSNNIMTPAEAKERISEIMNNTGHAYWVAHDPGHKAAVKRMLELQTLANPGASTDINDLRSGSAG
jgi:hypothetical protein